MITVYRFVAAASLALLAGASATVLAQEPTTVPSQTAVFQLMDNGNAVPHTGPIIAPSVMQGVVSLYGTKGEPGLVNIVATPRMTKAAYMGIAVDSADRVVQSQLKLPEGVGLVIKGVEPKSPAEAASLQENDVLVRVGDQIAINPDQLEVLVRSHKAGEAIECTVIRAAQAVKVVVTLGEREQPELGWVLASRHPMFAGQSQPIMINGTVMRGDGAEGTPAGPAGK